MSIRFTVLYLTLAFATAAFGADRTRTLVFFGDSITAGYGLEDPASESYPSVVQRKLEAERRPWRVVNAGLSGETSAGGLRRVDWILRQPVDVFVLALGGNDGLRGIEPAVTAQNLEAIVARVRSKYPEAKIVVAGMQMPPTMGEDYAKAFAEIYPSVAKHTHSELIPFLLTDVGGHPDLNQADGIHPTAEGATKVADNVWRALLPFL
jgi:acyl-CoA thioesterase-1